LSCIGTERTGSRARGNLEPQAVGRGLQDLGGLAFDGQDELGAIQARAARRHLLSRKGYVGLERGDLQDLQHAKRHALGATSAHLHRHFRFAGNGGIGHHDGQPVSLAALTLATASPKRTTFWAASSASDHPGG
jgi:hypothetical protein